MTTPALRTGDAPVRFGILGVARITEEALIVPAREFGARLVTIAARDPRRAADFARSHGIDRAAATYADVLADPDVDVVYNPLVNSLHGLWNLKAVAAGKHLFAEKPFASNHEEAVEVHEAGRAAGTVIFEGLHYYYHPGFQHLLELIRNGELGELLSVESRMFIPPPPEGDPRLSFALGGGASMDLGCYALHALRMMGEFAGGEPVVSSAVGGTRPDDNRIDEWVRAELSYPSGLRGTASSNLASPSWDTSLRVRGTRGTATVMNFARPQDDDRTIVTTAAGERTFHAGIEKTYHYQFKALIAAVRNGTPYRTDSADAVLTMRLIDDCYLAMGLRPRERYQSRANDS